MNDLKKIRSIFCEALDKETQQERHVYLTQACGEDTALRTEVEALLNANPEADKFFTDFLFGSEIPQDHISETQGTVIGRYKLLERIGEGGMAVVYMAQQEQPIRRKLALKIIKLGMDTKSVIARFEAERQALAILDHPNIAKVIDAGATETGRPYFVMELVRGVSITEYCDNNKLNPRERLDLFAQVCDAVQHAHRKGIIHRDIKPSNVMVTLRDGKPVPKVIDFGIAKATNQRLTEKTLFTQYAQFIGTPAYMSPEQAEFSELDIDTRTDIYSLGVLLYELLTGVTPFDADKLRKAAYSEIQRIIREEEPTKPSTKLSTMGEMLTGIAEHRRTQAALLPKLLRGDLDLIVMKALEKDRNRRYDSAGDFKADIRRHLNNEPVLASPPSVLYLIKKFMQRRRLLVRTVLAITVTLFIGLLISTYLYSWGSHIDIENKFTTAQTLYAEGSYENALRFIEENLIDETADGKIGILHARILFDLGRPRDAETRSLKLVGGKPEIASAAHCLLARIYAPTDRIRSQEHQRQAEALMPQTADAYATRALTAETPKVAVEWLTKALRLDTGHFASRRARALAYYGMRDYTSMVMDAEVMTAMRPKDSLGFALKALGMRETDKADEALSNYTLAIELCDVENELPKLYDQRVETYWRLGRFEEALVDAQQCVDLDPDSVGYRITLGKILLKLGRYEDAQQEFARTRGGKGDMGHNLRAMATHALDAARAGEPLNIPDSLKQKWPFLMMPHYFDLYQTLKAKATCLVEGAMDVSSWSPDGKQLAYTRWEHWGWGKNAVSIAGPASPSNDKRLTQIEVLDVKSDQTRILVTDGIRPQWSPDGRHIAYVCWPVGATEDEVWLVPSEGGQPRRLAKGGSASWTNHPTRLYFQSRSDDMLYCIDAADPAAEPKPVAPCPAWYPSVSPDERYLAYAWAGKLTVVEISSGRQIAKWVAPFSIWHCYVRWSPDGREISLGVSEIGSWRSGLWIYDLESREGRHLLGPPALCCNWSRDRSRLALDIKFPVSEIWLAQTDPNISTWQSLGPVQTRGEYMRDHWQDHVVSYSTAFFTGSQMEENRQLTAVAADQYDRGEYEDALWTLEHNAELGKSHRWSPDAEHFAYMTMTLDRLGRQQEAREALEQLIRICVTGAGEDEMHLYMAEKALLRNDSSMVEIWTHIERGELDEALRLLDELTQGDTANIEAARRAGAALARSYWRAAREAEHLDLGIEKQMMLYQSAIIADPNFVPVLRDLAWILAVSPDANMRNGADALTYAQRACELTEYRDCRCLAALAAAYAESNDFQSATKWQREAVRHVPEGLPAQEYRKRLELYESSNQIHAERLKPMVAWWKFEAEDKAMGKDASGNDLHGNFVGNAKIALDQARGHVLSLDGQNSWMDCGNDVRFNITDEITVSTWVNWNAPTMAYQAIISKGSNAWKMERNWISLGTMNFSCTGLSVPSDVWPLAKGTVNINDGHWHHIVGVYNGVQIYLYVDGELDASASAGGKLRINDIPVCIGGKADQPDFAWNGLIDDVRIYSCALSRNQIKALYEDIEQPLPHNLGQ